MLWSWVLVIGFGSGGALSCQVDRVAGPFLMSTLIGETVDVFKPELAFSIDGTYLSAAWATLRLSTT